MAESGTGPRIPLSRERVLVAAVERPIATGSTV